MLTHENQKPIHKQIRFWAGLYLLLSALFPLIRRAYEARNAKSH